MKILQCIRPLRRFLRDEKAATATEYAMIAAAIGVAVAATVVVLSGKVGGLYESVTSAWPS